MKKYDEAQQVIDIKRRKSLSKCGAYVEIGHWYREKPYCLAKSRNNKPPSDTPNNTQERDAGMQFENSNRNKKPFFRVGEQ